MYSLVTTHIMLIIEAVIGISFPVFLISYLN